LQEFVVPDILHNDMPITKSAIKKQRVDKRRTLSNMAAKGRLKTAIKDARTNPGLESLKSLYSAMDRAVKHHLVSKGHAARLKSRISKISKK
jgi:ribosomal protein S20